MRFIQFFKFISSICHDSQPTLYLVVGFDSLLSQLHTIISHHFAVLLQLYHLSLVSLSTHQLNKMGKVWYGSLQLALPQWKLACHMGSHSVTCHPAEVTFPPLPQPKLVFDLVMPEGCKAELTYVTWNWTDYGSNLWPIIASRMPCRCITMEHMTHSSY